MTLGDGEWKPEVIMFHDTFPFRVRACDRVFLRMSRSQKGTLDDSYEFVLDPRYGKFSELRKGGVSITDALKADLGGRLSCTQSSDFWISIDGDKLEVPASQIVKRLVSTSIRHRSDIMCRIDV